MGTASEKYRYHVHEKLAHYANAACDIEFEFPFGFKELEGIHSRTDFDLGNHEGRLLRALGTALNPDELLRLTDQNNPKFRIAPYYFSYLETERGRYLIEGPGHCAECHSPRNMFGAIINDMRFTGGPDPEGKGWVPNITPKGRTIESWSEDEIAELLKTGFTPDYDAVGGAMGHVVENTAKLSDEDRDAMADYLKSLPPRQGLAKPATP